MQGRIVFSSIILALATAAAPARADSGPFAVAKIADSSADLEGDLSLASGDETSFELGVGYAFNPYFAVQAGYQDFGELHGASACPPGAFCLAPDECPPDESCIVPSAVQAEISGWSLRATGAWPLGQRFAAFASVGVLVWDADADVRIAQSNFTFDIGRTGDDLVYEAGLRWRLTEQWNIEASYEHANLDIESTKLGLLFRF